MTAAAPVRAGSVRILRFFDSTIGKKAVMAISGVALFGFVFVHLMGNLQIFLGPDQFNGYARELRHLPVLVWSTRIILLVMVLLHIWSSLQLAVTKSEARPIGYVKHVSAGSDYASRTMYWSGPIIAAFVVYHLMQFTFGVGGHALRTVRRLRQRDRRIPRAGGGDLSIFSRWDCCACICVTACGACSSRSGFIIRAI